MTVHFLKTQDAQRVEPSETSPQSWEVPRFAREDVEFTQEDVEFTQEDAYSKAPAYVIFTSGSTGKPKGVVIQHQSVLKYAHWFNEYTQLPNSQLIDHSSNYCFDMAITTTIIPLLLGHTIVLCPDDIKKNTRLYLNHLKKNAIQLIKITPSYLKELLREIGNHPVDLPDLKTIILGGENLSSADCAQWLTLYPNHQLYNEYGPTEATVGVTQQVINTSNIHDFDSLVPIGRPASHVRCYLLNEHQEEVDPGELYLGGSALASGYLNDSVLTAKHFIHSKTHGRLYKTGDLCHRLPNGSLECLGRIDGQFKIRGFRVEPGEIEFHLKQCPTIQDALVHMHPNQEKLIAYCILQKPDETLDALRVRRYLQNHLPLYMIPQAFVSLPAFPLTANGKLNYKALPEPDLSSTLHVSPRTQLEETLQIIWGQELNLENISIENHFYELGGHSLNAARILSNINETLRIELKFEEFYRAETIAGLARFIQKNIRTWVVQATLQRANLSSKWIRIH